MRWACAAAVAALLAGCATTTVAPKAEDDMAAYLRRATSALHAARAGDEAELQALSSAVEKAAVSEPRLKPLASFLHEVAIDRRRLRDNLTASTAKLRDERRAHEALRARVDAAQERVTQLQQKLEALSALEKSLSDRPALPR